MGRSVFRPRFPIDYGVPFRVRSGLPGDVGLVLVPVLVLDEVLSVEPVR